MRILQDQGITWKKQTRADCFRYPYTSNQACTLMMDATKIHEQLLQCKSAQFCQANKMPFGLKGLGAQYINVEDLNYEQNINTLLNGSFETWPGASEEHANGYKLCNAPLMMKSTSLSHQRTSVPTSKI